MRHATLETSPKAVKFASELPNGLSDFPDSAEDPRWKLAQRVVASGILGRSRFLADFLLYIVDRYIRDRTDEITEQQIGVLVFGRTEGYDSNDDNIVRSYARNLRKRVDEYFATEGREETLVFEIPRGGYVPIFTWKTGEMEAGLEKETPASAACLDAADFSSEPPYTPPHMGSEGEGFAKTIESPAIVRWSNDARSTLSKLGVPLALCTGILLGIGISLFLLAGKHTTPAEAGSATLWAQIFGQDRDTFIVPSDDGLVIMQELIERPVPLAAYVSGSYRTSVKTNDVPASQEILKLGNRRYTSVVDLDLVAHLAQLREVVPERMMVRYARDLRMDDLRAANAVLIGSDEANPWIELFRNQMNFRFRFDPKVDKEPVIANLHPRSGENEMYANHGQERTYGIIAYLPNLDSTGHVLIVGGLNMAGTQAAGALLLNPGLMAPTLEHAKGADGKLQPFELLVSASNVAANASTPHVILERIGIP